MTDDSHHNDRIISQFTRWAQPFADLPIHSEEGGMARLLAAADIRATDHVLDVACGPGIVACTAAPHARQVTGIDLTPAMIEQARARQTASGLANLDWQVGDATALPFADASFDRVVTRYSFHHLREPRRALTEMRRVCRPEGRIVVIDATPASECQSAYDRMETLRDPSHTSALTVAQLRRLGDVEGLSELSVESYRLEALLSTLADPDDMAALDAMFDADIASGKDWIGVQARRADDGIRFHFPISVVAWQR